MGAMKADAWVYKEPYLRFSVAYILLLCAGATTTNQNTLVFTVALILSRSLFHG
jgi:hypothetical protein